MKNLTWILAILALGVCLAFAPNAESASSSKTNAREGGVTQDLKAAIAQAMQQNPDLRLAEAKLSEALAERDRVRLQVTRDLVRCHEAMKLAKTSIAMDAKRLSVTERMIQEGHQPTGAGDSIRLVIAEHEGRLREHMAERDYLIGKGSTVKGPVNPIGANVGSRPVKRGRVTIMRPELSDEQRAMLSTKVKVYAPDQSVADFMTLISDALGEKGFTTVFDPLRIDSTMMIDWRLKKAVTVQALFEWLSDRMPNRPAYVFRDYGIFVTVATSAQTIEAPCFPAVPLYRQF